MVKNRLGLDRHIPEATKRIIRKSCGFGCVVCGSVPYDYDHLHNKFHTVGEHDPDDIVLLCSKHHRLKTAGILSPDRILVAKRNRESLDSEARFKLELIRDEFLTIWGSNVITASNNSIMVDGEPILTLATTGNELEPLLISGQFRDRFGNVICVIHENEFVARSMDLGDFTIVANRFIYSMPDGTIGLAFTLDDQKIHISTAFHAKSDAHVAVKDDLLQVGNLFRAIRFERCKFLQNQTAISVGTGCDQFSFKDIDIRQIAGSRMPQCIASHSTVGVSVEGRKRSKITSNYDRL